MTVSHEVHQPTSLFRWIAAGWDSLRQASEASVRIAYGRPWEKDGRR